METDVKRFKNLLVGDLTHLGVLVAVGMEGESTDPVYRFTSCRVVLMEENQDFPLVVFGHLSHEQVQLVLKAQRGEEVEFEQTPELNAKLAYVTFKVPLLALNGQLPVADHADAVRKAFDILVRRPVGARIETIVEVLRGEEFDREDHRAVTIGNDALDEYLRTGR